MKHLKIVCLVMVFMLTLTGCIPQKSSSTVEFKVPENNNGVVYSEQVVSTSENTLRVMTGKDMPDGLIILCDDEMKTIDSAYITCGMYVNFKVVPGKWYTLGVNVLSEKAFTYKVEVVNSQIKPVEHRELVSSVMVNDIVYYNTGRESLLADRKTEIDGTIDSRIPQNSIPSKNNQSNFGVGYDYQIINEETGIIEVKMNDKWYIFCSAKYQEGIAVHSFNGKIIQNTDNAFSLEVVEDTEHFEKDHIVTIPDENIFSSRIPEVGEFMHVIYSGNPENPENLDKIISAYIINMTENPILPEEKPSENPEAPESDEKNEAEETKPVPTTPATEPPTEPPTKPVEPEPVYEEVNETVYSTGNVNIRKGPGTNYDVIGGLKPGQSITRVGIGDNGWSRVDYNGREGYMSSKYLTKEKPADNNSAIETDTNSPFTYQYMRPNGVMPFAMFTPKESNGGPLPLIISLHGASEVGSSENTFKNKFLVKEFRNWSLDGFDAYVVCPHLSGNGYSRSWNNYTSATNVFNMIDYLIENYNIDTSRIILQGHSLGGQGALYIAADSRACFSAVVPVSGYVCGADLNNINCSIKGYSGNPTRTDAAGNPIPHEDDVSYYYMQQIFTDYFGLDKWEQRNTSHDKMPRTAFLEDTDGDNKSDLVEWMLAQ